MTTDHGHLNELARELVVKRRAAAQDVTVDSRDAAALARAVTGESA